MLSPNLLKINRKEVKQNEKIEEKIFKQRIKLNLKKKAEIRGNLQGSGGIGEGDHCLTKNIY